MLCGGVGEHRLLKGGERPRLDDVGRNGPSQASEDERRQPTRQSKHGACDCHSCKQQAVRATSPEAVAVAGDQHRHERDPGEERSEHNTDRGVGEATIGQGETDQHRAEPVGKRPRGLCGDDPARVRAQARSS